MSVSNMSATKGNLLATKKSLELAVMGHDLMDKKHNILVREMMLMIDRANALRDKVDDTYATAYRALQNANITLGLCNSIAQSSPIENGLRISARSVMGVELPTVKLESTQPQMCYDFSSTNSAYDEALISFHNVKLMLVELAELENTVYRLAMAIRKTQSRANALKNIIIPNLTDTEKFITNALEEKEREEFSRLKVIKQTKEKQSEAGSQGA